MLKFLILLFRIWLLIITIKYWMLKWRGVWGGFWIFILNSNSRFKDRVRKFIPRAGIASSRIPALGQTFISAILPSLSIFNYFFSIILLKQSKILYSIWLVSYKSIRSWLPVIPYFNKFKVLNQCSNTCLTCIKILELQVIEPQTRFLLEDLTIENTCVHILCLILQKGR